MMFVLISETQVDMVLVGRICKVKVHGGVIVEVRSSKFPLLFLVFGLPVL